MKPIIGICMNYLEQERMYTLKDYYTAAIIDAGGTPILLPPDKDAANLAQYYRLCDGFLFTGGGDVDPGRWGALPHPMLGEITPVRDSFEIVLLQRILREPKPVLGICRGCQVMNVAAGGTVIQHIESSMSHDQKAPRYYPFHDIVIEKNTLLRSIIGEDKIGVNSMHHQAVGELGAGLKISACAADGITEAIESEQNGFFIGLQWHPECMREEHAMKVFTAFINKSGEER